MKQDVAKGTVCAIISAIVFGFTPVFASWSFDLGSNAMTLTFYRNSMVIPFMLVILMAKKVDLKINKSQFIQLALVSVFCSASTTFLLYAAYKYIGVGLSTTLHFLYPVITILCGFLIFKDKLEINRIIALILAFVGVALASGAEGSFGIIGVILAVASAVTYSAYLISIEKTAISDMHPMKAMFYMCLINTIVLPIIDLPFGEIVYNLHFIPLIYTFVVSTANSLFAYVLLIIGIKLIGAGNASIFSTLEPLSGVICGVLILGETMSVIKSISCILILIAVMIPIYSDIKNQKMK